MRIRTQTDALVLVHVNQTLQCTRKCGIRLSVSVINGSNLLKHSRLLELMKVSAQLIVEMDCFDAGLLGALKRVWTPVSPIFVKRDAKFL